MRKNNLLKLLAIPLALLLGMFQYVKAQSQPSFLDGMYVGAGTGVQFSSMRFSNLDKDRYPTRKGMSSPVWSLFVQKEFGNQAQFAVRPQLSFLKRGGKLKDIGRIYGYSDMNIKDVTYQLKSRYVDLRLPLLYQFLRSDSWVRPYAGLTPVLGFSTGGDIRLQEEGRDFSINGYEINLNRSNFSSAYFALAPTAGVRFNFHAGRYGQHRLFVNLEMTYEIGLTDTYSSKEKNGEAKNVLSKAKTTFDGTRKFSGFGLQAMIGIPFSVFKRTKHETPVVVEAPVQVVQPQPKPEKPCYTLEEINELIAQNKSVKGKTICAISDINFDFGKSTLQSQSYPYLNQLAQTIIKTNINIKVKGHTDNVGSDDFNMNLSRQRAEVVMNYLIKQGVDKNKISYTYYGSSRPLVGNDTEEGRTMNRRVEFEIEN